MSDRFYTSFPLALGEVILQGSEAHHLAAVCRFRAGDHVILFNGDGFEYEAAVIDLQRRQVSLQIIRVDSPDREVGFRLEVAAPLPKGDRGDFLLEKLTELGATDYVPLHSERSVVHPRPTKLERLQRTVIEASKQCGRNVLMRIHPLTQWSEYVARAELPSHRIIANPDAVDAVPVRSKEDVVVAVGPEGGFTPAEVDQALTMGWSKASLGRRILRIETAALAMAAILTASGG